jgi:hypothetical protein
MLIWLVVHQQELPAVVALVVDVAVDVVDIVDVVVVVVFVVHAVVDVVDIVDVVDVVDVVLAVVALVGADVVVDIDVVDVVDRGRQIHQKLHMMAAALLDNLPETLLRFYLYVNWTKVELLIIWISD